jgi:hypothetical protein
LITSMLCPDKTITEPAVEAMTVYKEWYARKVCGPPFRALLPLAPPPPRAGAPAHAK